MSNNKTDLLGATLLELYEAKEIITNLGAYVGSPFRNAITLDGEFSLEELKKLTAYLAYHIARKNEET